MEVTVYLEGKEVANAIDPFGLENFSFTPVFGYWDPEEDRIEFRCQGLVRQLRDVQRMSDKKANYILSILSQQAWHGLDFEEDALMDPEQGFKGGPTARIFNKGAIQAGKYRDRPTPDIPPGILQATEQDYQTFNRILGLNDEMFGMTTGNEQISGVLAKMRQGAGLVGLQDLYDNFSLSQKHFGEIRLKLYQKMSPGKVQRILNRQPSQEFYTKEFGEYDTVAAEGMLTDTQKNTMYTELVNLKKLGASIGEPFGLSLTEIVKNFAPVAQKSKLVQLMEQQDQIQAQAAQRRQQLQEVLQQLAIEQQRATIASEQSQNIERITQAQENRTGAALDRAKTMTEIQDLQGKPYMELLKMAYDLQKAQLELEARTTQQMGAIQ